MSSVCEQINHLRDSFSRERSNMTKIALEHDNMMRRIEALERQVSELLLKSQCHGTCRTEDIRLYDGV